MLTTSTVESSVFVQPGCNFVAWLEFQLRSLLKNTKFEIRMLKPEKKKFKREAK